MLFAISIFCKNHKLQRLMLRGIHTTNAYCFDFFHAPCCLSTQRFTYDIGKKGIVGSFHQENQDDFRFLKD